MAQQVTVSDTPGTYKTVAASQTDTTLGSTGAVGDYLQAILVVPASTSPGAVSIKDGSTSITVFAGGASSLTTLVPFPIFLGMRAGNSGGWKVTTGASLSIIATGNFS